VNLVHVELYFCNPEPHALRPMPSLCSFVLLEPRGQESTLWLVFSRSRIKSAFNQTSVMASFKSAATESKKRERALDIGDLKKLFDTEPEDYKIAWNEVKHRIIEFNDHARQTVPSVNFTQWLHYWYNKTNVNSLRRRLSLFLMHVKYSTCAKLTRFFGMALMNYQYLNTSQTTSIESWQSPPKPIKRTKHSHGR